GAIILGYNNAEVNRAITEQLKSGIIFTLPHPLELSLSEELVATIPCAEMVRFGKNGSDVTAGAVRLARAYTKREKIVCCGYHGWQDWYIGTTTRKIGVPESVQKLTLTFQYNNKERLEAIFAQNKDEIAAVIMEPIGVIEPKNNFLEEVKDLAHKNGALLIFDEIVTGLRISLGGAQEYYGVIPDIACFGKAMGNGMPISAIVGKKEIMRLINDVFFSFTFGGETLSLAASLATLKFMQKNNVVSALWYKGGRLKRGIEGLIKELGFDKYCKYLGLPPRTVMNFYGNDSFDGLLIKSYFQQECIKRGILFTGAHNISYAHSESDIKKTLDVYRDVITLTIDALENGDIEKKLIGPPVQTVFRNP
ncbi:MAG: aminotransferase class III-fold pyridoxal phosphate-dependent enzyme, partial [Thermodesulfobacteriota bacterium]